MGERGAPAGTPVDTCRSHSKPAALPAQSLKSLFSGGEMEAQGDRLARDCKPRSWKAWNLQELK